MSMLVDGVWQEAWSAPKSTGGQFVRSQTRFHGRIAADGSTPFTPEAGRYHLYVSLACPWAHRTLIFRKLKRLEEAISVSIVDPHMTEGGWHFSDGPGCIPDFVNGRRFLREVYTLADPAYTGRVTVPVLWDKSTRTIVNNESSEIIRMLNREFDAIGDASVDFYPEPLREEIDEINAVVYETVNNGVYRCGFATTQEAYDEAFEALFTTLDFLDERLGRHRYLCGSAPTEADWRLFTTLVRFDPVYVGHFKCNRRRIVDYANLSGYLRELYQTPGVSETVDLVHIQQHYYRSHTSINPNQIVPRGPAMDLEAPHGREALG